MRHFKRPERPCADPGKLLQFGMAAVASQCFINQEDLLIKKRNMWRVEPRWVLFRLLYGAGITVSRIAEMLTLDTGTISHGLGRLKELTSIDAAFAAMVTRSQIDFSYRIKTVTQTTQS